jgi:hypothetical protein
MSHEQSLQTPAYGLLVYVWLPFVMGLHDVSAGMWPFLVFVFSLFVQYDRCWLLQKKKNTVFHQVVSGTLNV